MKGLQLGLAVCEVEEGLGMLFLEKFGQLDRFSITIL